MRFKNIKHEERFIRACEDNQVDVTDTQLRGSLYLLTYKKKVWRYFRDKVESNDGIPPYYFLCFNSDNRTDINLVNAAYANAQLPKGRAVPSGSGSSDWKDRKNKKTLAEAVCYSMQRELAEECSLVSKRNYKKIMQATQTRLIGYWRWLQKGGKPEFSGVTKLGCKQSEIRSNDQEVCMLGGIGEYNQVNSKEDILEYLSNLKNACIIEKENETKTIMSFALYMNILFLEQYIEAEDHGCNKEVQDERVAFLLGSTLPKSKKSSKRKKKSH